MLRTRKGGLDVVPAHQLLFQAVSKEFDVVYGKKNKKLLYGAFEELLMEERGRFMAALVNSMVGSTIQMEALSEDAMKKAVKGMHDENYFITSGWSAAVGPGGHDNYLTMRAEQMSWELIAGMFLFWNCVHTTNNFLNFLAGIGGNGLQPLIVFPDPQLIPRFPDPQLIRRFA